MREHIIGFAMAPMLACSLAQAANFQCQDDVKPPQYTSEEQQLVDQFWDEALVYLREYLQVLETPTGQCKDSAEATIQTYLSATQKKQTRCILKYRDMELIAKHLKAILAEPDKAKACFDPQKNYKEFAFYTPSQELSIPHILIPGTAGHI